MARGSSAGYHTRRLERERQRRERQRGSRTTETPTQGARSADGPVGARASRATTVPCAWCGAHVSPGTRGPLPKWCSDTCRHRAWEQARAAACGRSAVEVIERRVEVPVALSPTRRDRARVLLELTAQLDGGRLYDRDLASSAEAIMSALAALERRLKYPRTWAPPRPGVHGQPVTPSGDWRGSRRTARRGQGRHDLRW